MQQPPQCLLISPTQWLSRPLMRWVSLRGIPTLHSELQNQWLFLKRKEINERDNRKLTGDYKNKSYVVLVGYRVLQNTISWRTFNVCFIAATWKILAIKNLPVLSIHPNTGGPSLAPQSLKWWEFYYLSLSLEDKVTLLTLVVTFSRNVTIALHKRKKIL